MRCGKCGNENIESNRFCGMCGAALLGKPVSIAPASGQTRSAAPVSVAGGPTVTAPSGPAAETRRASLASADDGPIITGPSFLGLNQPARGGGSGDRFGAHDSQHSSSGSLSYLLEDEEEPKRGWGKAVLLLLALALAGGFGYLHWKQGGFDWLNGERKPTPPTTTTGAAPSGTDAGSAPATSAPSPEAAPAQAAPGVTSAAPATGGVPENTPAGNASQSSQVASQEASAPPTPAPQTAASGNSVPPSKNNETGATAQSATASEDTESNAEPVAKEPVAKEPVPRKKMEARRAAAKPSAAKPIVAKPVDTVGEAERYIYGRGVRQDCDHGLRLLQPAAAQANPSAMTSLGTLYSTGTCTPRDLPTAYRWFALALHKQPDNRTLQDDLQKLWSRMTPPERQLAIKLSQ